MFAANYVSSEFSASGPVLGFILLRDVLTVVTYDVRQSFIIAGSLGQWQNK